MKKINILKNNITLMVLLFSTIAFGQTKQNLSKQLWERAQSCYADFEDTNDDGKLNDTEIIDDAKNGYLKISGTVGTCGCSCSKTIAAFKDNNENYTFLEQETSDCSWLHNVSSSRNLAAILPENFGIQSFIPSHKDTLPKEALFYLDFKIPQYGTETEVTLKIIPFGMHIESESLLVYGISEDDKNTHTQESGNIQQALFDLSDDGINLIINNKLANISKQDTDVLKRHFYGTKEEFSNTLKNLKSIYDLYSSIKYKSIILKWDKEKSKFYIEKKGEAVKPITFNQFLRNEVILRYWMATC